MTAAVHYDGSQVTELVSKPWVALYSDQVPADVTPVFADMLSVFRDAVRRNAGGPAIFYFDAVMDYATLDAESDALAVWLQARGVARGDRVAIVAQNIPAFPLLCLAAWKLGAVPVPGNPMYRAPELARIFADASPAAILCQDADAEEVCAALDLVGMSGLPLVFVSPRDWVGEAFCDRLPARNGVAEGERLADIIERGVGAAPGAIDIAPGELGLILYTSGTTGLPKGAMLTHGNMVFNAEVMHAWFSLGADDRILSIAPFFHVTGVECHICLAFRCAIAMVLHYRFEPLTVLEMIRAYRPTFTIGAITAMNAMMGAPGACAADMASLTKVFSGGAPIPPALRRVIGERLGISIHPTYGMTELTAPAVMTPFGHEAPERNGVLSIGLPAPRPTSASLMMPGQNFPSRRRARYWCGGRKSWPATGESPRRRRRLSPVDGCIPATLGFATRPGGYTW